jgi:hypothetical protein
MIAMQAGPPMRFFCVAHLGIDLCAPDATLTDKFLVLVGVDITSDLVDEENQSYRSPAEAIDERDITLDIERAHVEVKGKCSRISDYDESERNGKKEFYWSIS